MALVFLSSGLNSSPNKIEVYWITDAYNYNYNLQHEFSYTAVVTFQRRDGMLIREMGG